AGFDVVDLGTDVSKEKFVEAIRKEQPDIIGLSALLTTTMMNMKQVVEFLDAQQVRNKVKVIVGGAPISKNFASEIKADGYARDAASAVDVVKSLLHLDGAPQT
ncbi:MAG: cobalamin B12-binding domain-containing protein, partial [Ignavibacteriales bacterium]|nr:cobalamin B12-binding domain-containing protein [Ignavibacteriales bacterium]